MSSVANVESTLTSEDETIRKESFRLYSTMFGKLLDDADETPSLICDRLFLGSVIDARNADKLRRHNIKYVLNMAGSVSYAADFFTNLGLPYVTLLTMHAHDQDDYDISSHFPEALTFIYKSLEAADGAILVHCSAGVSRSAAIIAAFLMVVYKIGAAEAVLRVNQARPCACPNLGFLRQLLRFERKGFILPPQQ